MEQKNNKELFFYSAVIGLGFAHFVTAYRWFDHSIWRFFDKESIISTCYPFFTSCLSVSFESSTFIKSLLIFYMVLSAGLFIPLALKMKRVALVIFLALFVLKSFIFLSRYNIMGNYHIMHLSLIIGFLLCFSNIILYRLILCLQYFFAGLLKTNLEWLSGAALVSYPNILKGELFGLSLAYVVVLEIFLSWGLLSKNNLLRRITLLQLVIFHIYSYFIVGYFYPLVMLGILFPVLMDEISDSKLEINFKKLKSYKLFPCYAFILLVIFWNFKGRLSTIDPAKDGRRRYLSLNMLDARTQCNTKLIQIFPDESVRTLNFPKLASAIRVWCDPIFHEAYLNRLCKDPEFLKTNSKLHFHLETRKFTESKYETVREINDVCKKI